MKECLPAVTVAGGESIVHLGFGLIRGSLLNFLGCSLDPFPFASAIKCHQKSTSNSAGSSVGSLAPPRATPRLGGVYVSCQYFPCSFVLALRELGLRLGVKAQLPLRASSRLSLIHI